MPLHPFIAAELAAASAAGGVPYHQLPIEQARAQMKKAYARQNLIELAQVRDLQVRGPARPLNVRVYTPAASQLALPLTVFFHGSGFCSLDLDTHDEICRRLAQGSGSVVASVDYRLAPEHPFPAGPDDCLAATRELTAMAAELGADAAALSLAGDSAGACLAAVTALRLRDEGGPKAQALVLWYPVTDHPSGQWPSYQRYAQGYGLSAQGMAWFWSHYLSDPAQALHPHARPMRAPDLRGMPATWLMAAEYDVLCDEGLAFAERLRQAGVPVQSHCAQGLNHGFLKHAARLQPAADGMARACAWLRDIHAASAVPKQQ
ncbi:MAG: alpha/beta hydrolase fold domain-containing protein [Betaproteobacteria bacterium]